MIIEAWEKGAGPRQVSALARSYFKYIYAAIAFTLPSRALWPDPISNIYMQQLLSPFLQVVVRKPTTTWKTFEIPLLGLPHKAKSKIFGTERCLDWILRTAFSYKSIVSGKGGSLQPPKNHGLNDFVKGCQDALKHTYPIQPSIIQTSYLQAKHLP
jgi:hypothetical protein